MKKYGIDVKENMISEWSKIQQLCEEANNSLQVQADVATLGLTELLARLTEIANQLRDKLAIYPEYRLLIDLLNSYARIDNDTERFQVLIAALNANIDYVKIHAMNKGEEGDEPEPGPEATPVEPEEA